MPGRDGSGPSGMGPLTGRGMGACNGGARKNGIGCGYGGGRGMRGQGMNGKPSLRRQKAMLESQLEDINRSLGNVSEEEK